MTPETIPLLIAGVTSLCSICVTPIATIFATILGIAISQYFQSKNAQTQRQWELDDRQLNKRLDVLKLRISDAQDFINASTDNVEKLRDFEEEVIRSKKGDDLSQSVAEIKQLETILLRKLEGIVLLYDDTLRELTVELIVLIDTETGNAIELTKEITAGNAPDKNIVNERLTELAKKTALIRIRMQERLDNLARTLSPK
jgi:hypothetical protein